jgi:hypothetical protein
MIETTRVTEGANLKDIISFQIHRSVVNLYKKYFEITEDLLGEHKVFLSKIEARAKSSGADSVAPILKELDYFTEEKYNQIRKKILDAGNDVVRELERTLDFVEIELKQNKEDE